MINRLFVFLAIGVSTAFADPIDARDNLLLPTNPPRSKSLQGGPTARLFSKALTDQNQELVKTKTELKSALDSGLGKKHPTVMALQTKLAAIQGQLILPDQEQPEETEVAKLEREMTAMKVVSRIVEKQAKLTQTDCLQG